MKVYHHFFIFASFITLFIKKKIYMNLYGRKANKKRVDKNISYYTPFHQLYNLYYKFPLEVNQLSSSTSTSDVLGIIPIACCRAWVSSAVKGYVDVPFSIGLTYVLELSRPKMLARTIPSL